MVKQTLVALQRKLRKGFGILANFGFVLKKTLVSFSKFKSLVQRVVNLVERKGVLNVLSNFAKYVSFASRLLKAENTFPINVTPPVTSNIHLDEYSTVEPLNVSVSVIIPTYNAGHEFHWLLRKLNSQKGLSNIQIVIVDSGSDDETPAMAEKENCELVEILQSEFSHSYSRNIGAENATGDYLLFMVQDAYPIGDYWLFSMVNYLLVHGKENVVAVSCGEYCRLDSDLVYDCDVDTHQKFLMCKEEDRIGEFWSNEHRALRLGGQLSDVSCLISRQLFSQYRYQGDYAEDLDLGIRLIKNGYKIAMLASTKTIHSHNRPAYYYLKRSFVDTTHIVRKFDDFEYPAIKSFRGLFVGIVSAACGLTALIRNFDLDLGQKCLHEAMLYSDEWLGNHLSKLDLDGEIDLLDDDLTRRLVDYRQIFLRDIGDISDEERDGAIIFYDEFRGRLSHFDRYASEIYLQQDGSLREELVKMFTKNFASTVGSCLGFLLLGKRHLDGQEIESVERIRLDLQAGI
tara:strand:+ start:493 stop:2037 length:1545 start_codon:yes stop_codon:yes gene_type:complete